MRDILTSRTRAGPQKRPRDSLSDEEFPSKKPSGVMPRTYVSNTAGAGRYFDIVDSTSSSDERVMAPASLEQRCRSDDTIMDDGVKVEFAGSDEAVNPGLSALRGSVTKLVDLITTLRDKGIQHLDVDLPQIVVVGDQSTGKSSLIEGLIAIKVSRNEGTCTRCPIEINLKATKSAWHCRISIVKKYGYNAPESRRNNSLGLGPYNEELPQAIIETFAEVTDKDDIPVWLARAQLAVLNPERPTSVFAVPPHLDVEITTPQERFSPNVIRLEISAPNLPSLSLFDLPGVIVQDEETHVPALICNLVKSYIMPSKSLVLLTLPFDSDRADSSAAGLISEANADDRTIGIISKPDRSETADIQQWKVILSGEKFNFKLGYRVVRNPADPSVDHTEARRQEGHFFETNPHFIGPLVMFKKLFGTENLQEFLSLHLVSMVKKCLPEINQKVRDRLLSIRKELDTLAKSLHGNPFSKVQQQLADFSKQLKAIVNNSVDSSSNGGDYYYEPGGKWFQRWHKEAQIFFEKLVRSAPQLDMQEAFLKYPSAISGGKKAGQSTEVVEIGSDSGFEIDSETVPKNSTGQTTCDPRQRKSVHAFVHKHTRRFTFTQVRDKLDQVNGGVFGTGDPRVFEHLLKESIEHWPDLLKQFLQTTAKACKELVTDLLNLHFKDQKHTKLLQVIQESAQSFVDGLEKNQMDISNRLLICEQGKPLNLDHTGSEKMKGATIAKLRQQFHQAEIRKRAQALAGVGNKASAAEKKKIAEEVQSAPDQHENEIKELAVTISYYEIAAERFANCNCLLVRNEFFHALVTEIVDKIRSDLRIEMDTDDDVANEHLKELIKSPGRDIVQRKVLEARREELEGELTFLKQTRKSIVKALVMEDTRR